MILICPEHSFSRPISCRVTRHIPCGFVSRATSAFSPFQAILRKETNIVQKGELQEEVIAKIQQARPAERWGERPKQGRHAFTTRIRHCGPPTARDFYTPWYKTVLRAFTPSQGTAGQRSFVPVRTAARPMDLIAWKRVLDGRTMSGYSNCIEYLIERQSTFAMWKFAACVSALQAFRRYDIFGIRARLQTSGRRQGRQGA